MPAKATTSRPSTAPVSTAARPVLIVEHVGGAERHARKRAIAIFSQMVIAICSRVPSARSGQAEELIEVYRAVPGS
jgi:hypothetical protein